MFLADSSVVHICIPCLQIRHQRQEFGLYYLALWSRPRLQKSGRRLGFSQVTALRGRHAVCAISCRLENGFNCESLFPMHPRHGAIPLSHRHLYPSCVFSSCSRLPSGPLTTTFKPPDDSDHPPCLGISLNSTTVSPSLALWKTRTN